MITVLDHLSELVYISDMETYDILFLNEAGVKQFHAPNYRGQKCHKLLQGRDTPCPFCTNHLLSSQGSYDWEITNPITNRHYLLKDLLIDWEGKQARMEIAFDITEKQREKTDLENTLRAESTVMDCIRELYSIREVSEAIPHVFERIGRFLKAERVYLFAIDGERMSNTYEWCAAQITPQIHHLQQLDVHLIDTWRESFARHECYILHDLDKELTPGTEAYERLAAQGIHSLVVAPLEREGKLSGYLGVDNPPVDMIRNIFTLFQTLRYFIMAAIRLDEDEQMLTKLSFHDMLTGAYNRNRYLWDIAAFAQSEQTMGIVFMDVNGLKDINDREGHIRGDQILVECAQKAVRVFGQDRLYRVGGDEFILICRETREAEFLQLVSELKNQFYSPESCAVAIGYQWAATSENIQQLTAAADAMMYADKRQFYRSGALTRRYRHFNDDLFGMLKPGALLRQMDDDRFMIYLQPRMAFGDERLLGAEALIRYRTQDGEVVDPSRFLPDLEHALLIGQVDFFVFRTVCETISRWLREGRQAIPISVNFSNLSLHDRSFVDKLLQICESYRVNPSWLEIEISESMDELPQAEMSTFLEELRAAGFLVAVDDFGMRSANLSLLIALNYDKLKVDKALIAGLANPKTQLVLKALAKLCKDTGTRTTVEGIETREQFDLLKAMGFDEVQGYLINRPLPVDDFEARYILK